MASPLRFDHVLSNELSDALNQKLRAAATSPYSSHYCDSPYFAFKTAEKALEGGKTNIPMGHAVITQSGSLYDYCAKKHYTSFEAWYEDRGRELLGLAVLPPLSSELCFGRCGQYYGYLTYSEILAVIAKTPAHNTSTCKCDRCSDVERFKAYAARRPERLHAAAQERAVVEKARVEHRAEVAKKKAAAAAGGAGAGAGISQPAAATTQPTAAGAKAKDLEGELEKVNRLYTTQLQEIQALMPLRSETVGKFLEKSEGLKTIVAARHALLLAFIKASVADGGIDSASTSTLEPIAEAMKKLANRC
jgi:hypothetical protein